MEMSFEEKFMRPKEREITNVSLEKRPRKSQSFRGDRNNVSECAKMCQDTNDECNSIYLF